MRTIFKIIRILIGIFLILFSFAGVSHLLENGFSVIAFLLTVIPFVLGVLLVTSSIKNKVDKSIKEAPKVVESLEEVTVKPKPTERIDFSKKNERNERKAISKKKSRKYRSQHSTSWLYKSSSANTNVSISDSSTNTSPYTPIKSDDIFEFMDLNESKLEKMVSKIEEAWDKAQELDNPDDVVKQYKNAINLAKQLEDFCHKGGYGGSSYFYKYLSNYEESLNSELQQYIEEEYDNAMEDYLEVLEYEKKVKSINRKIIKLIKSGEVHYQKDLYGHFDSEDKRIVINCLNKLVESGKIVKIKSGNTNQLLLLD